jgi:hypothetical protein
MQADFSVHSFRTMAAQKSDCGAWIPVFTYKFG